jgi:hypothetical protein
VDTGLLTEISFICEQLCEVIEVFWLERSKMRDGSRERVEKLTGTGAEIIYGPEGRSITSGGWPMRSRGTL